MGVMPCYRTGCENILCRRIIFDRQYICDDCWDELVRYKNTWKGPMTEAEIKVRIEQFMETDTGSYSIVDDISIDRMFDLLTGNDSSDEEY
jgi:hypothetical protein